MDDQTEDIDPMTGIKSESEIGLVDVAVPGHLVDEQVFKLMQCNDVAGQTDNDCSENDEEEDPALPLVCDSVGEGNNEFKVQSMVILPSDSSSERSSDQPPTKRFRLETVDGQAYMVAVTG